MTLPLVKLSKALDSLQAAVNGASGTIPRRHQDIHARTKELVRASRDIFLATDFRSGDSKLAISRTYDLLLSLIANQNESLRTAAHEAFLAVSRHVVSMGQETRLLLVLISELNKAGPARAVNALLALLARTIHLAKPKRLSLFSLYALSAVEALLGRPEEAVHLSLIANLPLLFKTVGPQLDKLTISKDKSLPFEKNSQALHMMHFLFDKCLDVRGTPNRSAVTAVVQLASYSPLCLERAVSLCCVILAGRDDQTGRVRLAAAINVLKGIWEPLVADESALRQSRLSTLVSLLLCCTHSSVNEVIIASCECLSALLSIPTIPTELLQFYPPSVPLPQTSSLDLSNPSPIALLRDPLPSLAGSPFTARKGLTANSSFASQQSSPLSSTLDLRSRVNDLDAISVNTDTGSQATFNGEGTSFDRDGSPLGSWEDEKEEGRDDIIDPLLNPDLYDEERRKLEEESISDTISVTQPSSSILENLPDLYYKDSRWVQCPEYTAAIIAARFLLLPSGIGLKPDSEVRVSHKMLALNVCTACCTHSALLTSLRVPTGASHQHIREVLRLIHHEDDKLAAAAIAFAAAAESAGLGNEEGDSEGFMLYVWERKSRVASASIRKALLQSLTGKQRLLQKHSLELKAVQLALASTSINYALLKVTVAQFLGSLEWSLMSGEVFAMQTRALDCLIDLLTEKDPAVIAAASEALTRFVDKSEFATTGSSFSLAVTNNAHCGFAPLPMVLALPEGYSFREAFPSPAIEKNLCVVIEAIMKRLSRYTDSGLSDPTSFDHTSGLISVLSSLAASFPPNDYVLSWSSHTRSSIPGILGLLTDIADTSVNSPSLLAKTLRLQALLLAGNLENQMMDVVAERVPASKRTFVPVLPDAPLLDRMLLMPLRILNLYYCVVEERRGALSGRHSLNISSANGSNKGARPLEITMSLSRLPGTGITQPKSSQFPESASLCSVGVLVRGAFKNFQNSLDPGCDMKVNELLLAAVHNLCVLLEMHRLADVRPLFPELCRYIEVLVSLCPLAMTRLATQLLKMIFGRNAAQVNLGHLKSIRPNRQAFPRDKPGMLVHMASAELQEYGSRINDKEATNIDFMRHFGWMSSAPSLIPINHPASEVMTALKLFENYITCMLPLYGQSTDTDTKIAILTLFSVLRVAGVEFDLVDPRKMVTVSVEEQLGFVLFPDMLRETFCFLIVLARSGTQTWTAVRQHAVALCAAAHTERCRSELLDGLEVVLYELLFNRKIVPDDIFQALFNASSFALFMKECPLKYLRLLKMWMHKRQPDEESWRDASVQLLSWLTTLYNSLSMSHSLLSSGPSIVYALIDVVCSVSPSSVLPIERFLGLLQSCFNHERRPENGYEDRAWEWRCGECLVMVAPLIFFIRSSSLGDDRFMHRTEGRFADSEGVLGWLFDPIARWLRVLGRRLKSDCSEGNSRSDQTFVEAAAIILRTLAVHREIDVQSFMFKEFIDACVRQNTIDISDVVVGSPRLAAEWINFFSSSPDISLVPVVRNCAESILRNMHDRYARSLALQCLARSFAVKGVEDSVAKERDALLLSKNHDSHTPLQMEFALATHGTSAYDSFAQNASEETLGQFLTAIAQQLKTRPTHQAIVIARTVLSDSFCRRGMRVPTQRISKASVRFGSATALLDCKSDVDVLKFAIKEAPLHSRLVCYSVRLPTDTLAFIFNSLGGEAEQSQFIRTALPAMARFIGEFGKDTSGRLNAIKMAEELIEIFPEDIGPGPLLSLLANLPKLAILNVPIEALDDLISDTSRILQAISTSLTSVNSSEAYAALTFFLQHPTTLAVFSKNQLLHLNAIHDLLYALMKHFVAREKINERYERPDELGDFVVNGVDTEGKELNILHDCYECCQFLMRVCRERSARGDDCLVDAIRSILRLPLLNGFALTPKPAVDGGWKPAMELRSEGLLVSLPPIHKLNDITVLEDFTWRTLFLGWISRQQFESLWVSLVGVLSSTPSGDELNTDQAVDTICVSTLAVRRLFSVLLLTQLEPQPGNPVGGRIRVPLCKSRSTFYNTRNYEKLCCLLSLITGDENPTTILQRNLEGRSITRFEYYQLDQLNIEQIWEAIGTGEPEINLPRREMRPSSSVFLQNLRLELDASSAVRSLHENLLHWLSRGVNAMPIGLLSETLHAIALLCDLFEDMTSFSTLESDMRMVLSTGYISDHADFGVLVCTVCKAIAVCAPESLRIGEEHMKNLLALIITGVEHRRSSARCASIRGVLLLLQAHTDETVAEIVKYLVEWSLREIEKCVVVTDSIFNTGDHTCAEYQSLLWALVFRLIEHPNPAPIKTRLFQVARDSFSASVPLPPWQMEVLTRGLQQLCLHSDSFAHDCYNAAIACLDKYTSFPYKLPFALRLLATTVFRDERLISSWKEDSKKIINIARVCDGGEQRQIFQVVTHLGLLISDPIQVLSVLYSQVLPVGGRSLCQPTYLLEEMARVSAQLRATPNEHKLLALCKDIIATNMDHRPDAAPILCLVLAALSPRVPHSIMFWWLLDRDREDAQWWETLLHGISASLAV